MAFDLDPSEGIALFTDGSANSGDRSGGWAWVALDAFGHMDCASGYKKDTTVNRMELYAPNRGLLRIHECLGPCSILVYSDSLYVVLGNQDKKRQRRVNKSWWNNLDQAIDLHEHVAWQHVKGHSDSLYNGLADRMASEARKEGLRGNK